MSVDRAPPSGKAERGRGRVKIAPSILSSDFAILGEQVRAVAEAGADFIHMDVMDGHFVPTITFGPAVIAALRSYTDVPFDVHLMVAPVEPHLKAFREAGADILTIHGESEPHIHRCLQAIRASGAKAGLALNPGTSVESVDSLLDLLDLVLVMSVNPGAGGQVFLESQLAKIAAIRERIDASGREISLEVDGGLNAETAARVIDAGADILVAGSAIFGGDAVSYAQRISALRGGA